MALKKPDLIWYTNPDYNETRLNIDNKEGVTNLYSADAILSAPVSRKTNYKPYVLGVAVYNILQNDNSDRVDAVIKNNGQVMVSYLFNYKEMAGDLTLVFGLRKTLKEAEKESTYIRIVSGTGVFATVTGFIAREPYVDADGVTYQKFSAYFDNL